MPWKECSVMDERLQFVGRRLAGEPMAERCREYGISRKNGYKIFDRYQESGVHGLTDRSRRPYRYANRLPFQVENYILNVKREHPSWGARKIRERLVRRFSDIKIPAKATARWSTLSSKVGTVVSYCLSYSGILGSEFYPLRSGNSLSQRLIDFWCERHTQAAASGATHGKLSLTNPAVKRIRCDPEAGCNLFYTQLAGSERL